MKYIYLFIFLFSLTFISALTDENNIYSDCSIYGNCQPITSGGGSNVTNYYNNYTNITANLSNYYQKNETYNTTQINNNLSNYYLNSNPNNYYNSSTLPNQSANLTGYAMLNGTNQPFTGDLNINKSNPCYNMTNTLDGTRHYICKDGNGSITFFNEVGSLVATTYTNITNMTSAFFDGVNDYAESADSAVWEPPNGTWSVWMRPIGAGSNADEAEVYMKARKSGVPYAHWALAYLNGSTLADGTKRIAFFYYNTSSNGHTIYCNVTFNQWNHIVIVKNNTNLLCYKNGELANMTSAIGPIVYNTGMTSETLTIGAARYGGAFMRQFHGYVDEFAVWNRTLNITEIQILYTSQGYLGLRVNTTNPVYNNQTRGGFNFNEGSGSVYINNINTSLNATLFNGAMWATSPIAPIISNYTIQGTNSSNVTYIEVRQSSNASYNANIDFGNNQSNLTIKSKDTWFTGFSTFLNTTYFRVRAYFSDGIEATGNSTFIGNVNVTQNLTTRNIIETGNSYINNTLTFTGTVEVGCRTMLLNLGVMNETYINGRRINTTACT